MSRWNIVLAAIALLALAAGCSDSESETEVALESGFVDVTIAGAFTRPTDFAFTPDGRAFVAQQAGAVLVVKDGIVLSEPFIELTVNVYHERGLLAVAVDPEFESNGFVYLYYVNENDRNTRPGPKTAQLLRVTADGDAALPGSEVVLLGSIVGDPERPSCDDYPAGADCIPADEASHNGGGIGFTPDGEILLAIGDAEQFLPAQDLDYLGGKLVRIDRDGNAPTDNPFYDGPDASRSKVWSLGLRNPFRLTMRPGTSTAYIGDVGSLYEEIDVSAPGANYGWPCFSGPEREADDALCDDFVASGDHLAPVYAYEREDSGAAIIVGAFYQGGSYPADLDGALLFGDFVMGTISAVHISDDGTMIDDGPTLIYEGAESLVALEIGPEGDLYYLSNGRGELHRLCYVEAGDSGCPEDGS